MAKEKTHESGEKRAEGGKSAEDTAQKRKRATKGPVSDRITALGTDLERVRTREEARFLRVAHKAGLFSRRITTAELAALFDPEPGTPTRQSQLARLETTMKKLRKNQTAEARRDDARRKILLGSFLIAQFEHKPALKAEMQPELERFLDQHRDAGVAAANKALLAEWLTARHEG